jgi:CBS domain-containing protein
MSVVSLLIHEVEAIAPDTKVIDAARQLRDSRVGSLVVIDEQRRPMGIVSDRDVTVRLVAAGRDAARTSVRDIMTPMPTTVLRDSSIESVLGAMRMGRVRRLPVVDGLGRLIGIVTLDDTLRLLAEELGEVERLLEEQRPPHASSSSAA